MTYIANATLPLLLEDSSLLDGKIIRIPMRSFTKDECATLQRWADTLPKRMITIHHVASNMLYFAWDALNEPALSENGEKHLACDIRRSILEAVSDGRAQMINADSVITIDLSALNELSRLYLSETFGQEGQAKLSIADIVMLPFAGIRGWACRNNLEKLHPEAFAFKNAPFAQREEPLLIPHF